MERLPWSPYLLQHDQKTPHQWLPEEVPTMLCSRSNTQTHNTNTHTEPTHTHTHTQTHTYTYRHKHTSTDTHAQTPTQRHTHIPNNGAIGQKKRDFVNFTLCHSFSKPYGGVLLAMEGPSSTICIIAVFPGMKEKKHCVHDACKGHTDS